MTDLPEGLPPPKRPVLVWVICLYYFICVPFGLLSLALIPLMLSGSLPVPDAQRRYLESLTYFDHGATIIIALAGLTGAVLLFMLRRQALYFFVVAFAVNLLVMVYNIVARNFLEAIGISGMVGAFFGYAIIIAIILYIRHLSKKGVLR